MLPVKVYLIAGAAILVLAIGSFLYWKIGHDAVQLDRAKTVESNLKTKEKQSEIRNRPHDISRLHKRLQSGTF